MEDILEDTSLNSVLSCISNSSKFKSLCKTIYTLRTKYLARGIKLEQVNQMILCKIFNSKCPVAVNWLSLKSTMEYHKIKNLVELDPKTIELALAIHQEIEKTKKKKKHEKQTKDYTLDDMLDLFQYRLESNLNLDKNSSSSNGSESNPSDLGENHVSPEHPGLSYAFEFEALNYQTTIGKRKLKKNSYMEDDLPNEAKGDPVKKLKVVTHVNSDLDIQTPSNANFYPSDLFYEPTKREREFESGGIKPDRIKCFKK